MFWYLHVITLNYLNLPSPLLTCVSQCDTGREKKTQFIDSPMQKQTAIITKIYTAQVNTISSTLIPSTLIVLYAPNTFQKERGIHIVMHCYPTNTSVPASSSRKGLCTFCTEMFMVIFLAWIYSRGDSVLFFYLL